MDLKYENTLQSRERTIEKAVKLTIPKKLLRWKEIKMKNALLLSCLLILFSMACGPPKGFLIDDTQKSTLKDIDKLFLVIEFKSDSGSFWYPEDSIRANRAGYKKLDFNYVFNYARNVLRRVSGLEVEYSNNKNTDKSFIFIKMRSKPNCGKYQFARYRCPGGTVLGNVSLYVKGEKIFYETFYKVVTRGNRYMVARNDGEKDALRKSNLSNILITVGFEILKHSSK